MKKKLIAFTAVVLFTCSNVFATSNHCYPDGCVTYYDREGAGFEQSRINSVKTAAQFASAYTWYQTEKRDALKRLYFAACGNGSYWSITYGCANGATDNPTCTVCPSGSTMTNNQCVCNNGANNAPTCNTCPSGLSMTNNICACSNGATNPPPAGTALTTAATPAATANGLDISSATRLSIVPHVISWSTGFGQAIGNQTYTCPSGGQVTSCDCDTSSGTTFNCSTSISADGSTCTYSAPATNIINQTYSTKVSCLSAGLTSGLNIATATRLLMTSKAITWTDGIPPATTNSYTCPNGGQVISCGCKTYQGADYPCNPTISANGSTCTYSATTNNILGIQTYTTNVSCLGAGTTSGLNITDATHLKITPHVISWSTGFGQAIGNQTYTCPSGGQVTSCDCDTSSGTTFNCSTSISADGSTCTYSAPATNIINQTYSTKVSCLEAKTVATTTTSTSTPQYCSLCPSGSTMVNNQCTCSNAATPQSNCTQCPSGKVMDAGQCVTGCDLTNVCGQTVQGVLKNGVCSAPSGSNSNINNSCISNFHVSAESVNPNGAVTFSWTLLPLKSGIRSTCGFVDLTTPTPRPIPGLQNLDPSRDSAKITNIQATTRFCLICQFFNTTTNASLGDAVQHQWVRVIRVGEN